jgi:hypothetical protein
MTRSRPITFAAAAVIQLVALAVAACGGGRGAATTAAVSPPKTSSGAVAGREITDESTTSPFSKPAKLATCCVAAAMVSRKFKPTFR